MLKYQNAPNSFPQKDLPLLKEINSFLKSVITCFCALFFMSKPCSLRNKAESAKGIWKAKQSFLLGHHGKAQPPTSDITKLHPFKYFCFLLLFLFEL